MKFKLFTMIVNISEIVISIVSPMLMNCVESIGIIFIPTNYISKIKQ
jgi:hypothetical protein